MIFYSLVSVLILGLSNAQNATVAPEASNATVAPEASNATVAPPPPTVRVVIATTSKTESTTETATDPPTDPPTTVPPPKSLSVVCTHEEMTVYLEHRFHPNLNLDSISLKDKECSLEKGKEYGDANNTHVWLMAPFDGCATTHNTTDKTITYQNSMIAETRQSAGSILISREFQAEFPFKCTYPRSAIVSVASFSPREKVIYTRTAELGNFTFLMDMYKTDQYEEPYDSYPVKVDLDQSLYLEVKVVSNDSKLVLFPDRCWATPSSDPDDGKFYDYILDGCGKDDTLVFDYKEDPIQRFQMAAFRFLRESADPVVYLHCSVEACRKGDNNSRCAEGCVENDRKRRDLYLDAISQQVVSIGPVTRVEPKEEEAKKVKDKEGFSLTVIGTIAGVLGVVVLVLLVALVMLYRRFTAPQNPPQVVYSKQTQEEKNLLV